MGSVHANTQNLSRFSYPLINYATGQQAPTRLAALIWQIDRPTAAPPLVAPWFCSEGRSPREAVGVSPRFLDFHFDGFCLSAQFLIDGTQGTNRI